MFSRSSHQENVDEFMRKAGQDVPGSPVIPDAKIRKLRAKLIFEECLETIAALGFEIRALDDTGRERKLNLEGAVYIEAAPCNIVEVVDGCCDIKVVTTGTLTAFGISDNGVQMAIDEANLKKFGPGGYRRDDGKWVKPPDWKAPDLLKLLVEQGYQPPA